MTGVQWRPQAYLFDMDGLLLDTERLYQRVFQELTAFFGIDRDTDADFFLTLVGTPHPHVKSELERRFDGAITIEQFFRAWIEKVQDHAQHGVPLKPTVRDTLEALHGQGAVMAVVTSSMTRNAEINLTRAGLRDYFEVIKGGDLVSQHKPHPAPYLETAAELGLQGADCAAFEDSDPGITAAMAAGCRAVQIPDLRPRNKPLPNLGQHVASDLAAGLKMIHRTK